MSNSNNSNSNNSEGLAHGKVILFGEHAVVYGVPAIAVGIDRGARAVAAVSPKPSTLRVKDWNFGVRDDDTETPLARAFHDLLRVTREAGVAIDSVAIEAEANLPPGGGLGCSAALGVAVARALDPSASPETIAERANVWEGTFHGNPSGVDTAISALGGCVEFTRATVKEDGTTSEPAKIQRVRVPGMVHLCVGNTGQASSTRSMVESVARMRERRPETTKKAFDAIHTIVKNARLAIEAGDRRAVGQYMDLNQMLLSGLFVSTPEIEQMCASARVAGAFGSKLTGAGGGGCVVALVDTAEIGANVLSAWKADGFDGFVTTFGSPPGLSLIEALKQRAAAAPKMLEGTP